MLRVARSAASLTALAALLLMAGALHVPRAAADEGWVIRSFDVTYDIDPSGSVAVLEDIRVDFGTLQRHGIFRDIPVEYAYDSQNNRLTTITNVSVDDGAGPLPFELIGGRPNLRIRIGDPARLISGAQRYRISYTAGGALNPFVDHDEFYWNATGDEWPVMIESASAGVRLPADAVQQIACFEGATGSTLPCKSEAGGRTASFSATTALPPGAGLTIVVGIDKGAVLVPPLDLVPSRVNPWDDAAGFLGLNPLPIGIAAVLGVLALVLLVRQWWVAGRDRWYGNMFYAVENPAAETMPLFADETIVVEYEPPELKRRARHLRPAEIGLLLDEQADTLDVSATIVDLAVRKYLTIRETESGGVFGLFKSRDYELVNLKQADAGLLEYEKRLLTALFDGKESVKLSDLKNKFYKDLAKVKNDLYDESVKELGLFPQNPETVRTAYRIAGVVVGAAGATGVWLLGTAASAGVIGIPVGVAGALMFVMSPAMPRRTAAGRLAYRRCLGFRRYMVTAETERQKFAEQANLFDEYLPYAIVYGCVEKWAKAFEGLGVEGREMGWYAGSHPFTAAAFASSIGDFSSSVSTVMASTPGGSGGSGFGGGSSGGGGGGGGGGSW